MVERQKGDDAGHVVSPEESQSSRFPLFQHAPRTGARRARESSGKSSLWPYVGDEGLRGIRVSVLGQGIVPQLWNLYTNRP